MEHQPIGADELMRFYRTANSKFLPIVEAAKDYAEAADHGDPETAALYERLREALKGLKE